MMTRGSDQDRDDDKRQRPRQRQRQETERENTRASTAKFEQMRESLTGQTFYVEEDAEDTRVHILHVTRSNMQNGVKPPRVLVIET